MQSAAAKGRMRFEGSTIHEASKASHQKKLRLSHRCAMWGIRSIVYSLSIYFDLLGYPRMGTLYLSYNFIK
jgi:hypothetical protein